jgi:starch synthase
MTAPRVLSVASEIYPLVKTGGLADVAGALPLALADEGIVMHSLIPGYPAVLGALNRMGEACRFGELFGGPARLLSGRSGELDLFAIEAPHLYDRPGGPYAAENGVDFADNAVRFAALGWVAAAIGRGAAPGFVPDVVHAHDWQAGLTPAYLHYGPGRARPSVMTIHNLAYQGQFPAYLFGALRLPGEAFSIEGVEYFGGIGFLKAGLRFADRITTVSPGYAEEILAPAGGMGLDGLLRNRSNVLAGILNGIDTTVWNPTADPLLPARFDAARLDRRAADKAALQNRLGLDADASAPLFGAVGRLAWQKGMDLLIEAVPTLLECGGQLAMLGSGEHALEGALGAAAAAHPGRVGAEIGYDEGLAHLIQGGADVLVVPSRFEPCGLVQLCALRYGALPLVARVGGLSDTVIDANEAALAAETATGFQFAPVTRAALEAAIRRAARLWPDRAVWRRMQMNAMATDVGWTRPARRYAALYRQLAA